MGLRTVIQGGVEKIVNRGYVLELGHTSETFADESEFSAYLKNRIGVPADAMMRLRELPIDRLRKELAQTEVIYKQMLQALLQVVENNEPVAILWRDLDISVLPDEQQWPAILFGVSSSEQLTPEMKRETVQRFVEFLRSRKNLLRQLWASRSDDTAKGQEFSETAEVQLKSVDGGEPVGKWPLVEEDVTIAARTVGRNYRRIEPDRRFEIRLGEGEKLPIYLSRWKVELTYSAGTLMLEEEGNRMTLPQGAHHAGRSNSCSIALTAAPLDVSRKHLTLENLGEGVVALTDHSSKGTWIPDEFLKRGEE